MTENEISNIVIGVAIEIDLLVENKFLIEIKSVESLTVNHLAQTLTYLKL